MQWTLSAAKEAGSTFVHVLEQTSDFSTTVARSMVLPWFDLLSAGGTAARHGNLSRQTSGDAAKQAEIQSKEGLQKETAEITVVDPVTAEEKGKKGEMKRTAKETRGKEVQVKRSSEEAAEVNSKELVAKDLDVETVNESPANKLAQEKRAKIIAAKRSQLASETEKKTATKAEETHHAEMVNKDLEVLKQGKAAEINAKQTRVNKLKEVHKVHQDPKAAQKAAADKAERNNQVLKTLSLPSATNAVRLKHSS